MKSGIRDQAIALDILRQGQSVFTGEVKISQIKRSFEELVQWLFRDQSFPQGVVLLTGTGIVPPNEFSLQKGDQIRITIEAIGTLQNTID